LKAGKVHVNDSKNRQDRFVPLPASLEPLILSYWRSFPPGMRPRLWLFTQQRSLDAPMDKQWVQDRILKQRDLLGIDGRLTAHSFRHAFATHSYENGMDLLSLKAFLGHRSINSTAIYVHLAAASSCTTVNPFDQIGGSAHA
ncbi:tyrosine-type recombinase/integrase, partial [Acetatifactor aquisgranensis]|uniref:tyrosine-type recombinase/integrase n=1 Tax=Acetatifactor aquisgranensis TaxID=2941233 RepID=UPI00203BB6C5